MRLLQFIGMSAGGWLGWYLGARVGIMTALFISLLGSGLGIYLAWRVANKLGI